MASLLTGKKCIYSPATTGDCHRALCWCSQCQTVLCENHWGDMPTHKSATSFIPGVMKEHKKTELDIANYIFSVLYSKLDEEQTEEGHVSNVHTRWFGVQIDENNSASLKSKPFHEFAWESRGDPSLQYPCLVSFVGETGSGKSTLINAMMKSVEAPQIEETTPVIGTKIDIPTSGDVHLFPDPKSLCTQRPLFFADCEGFGGGNGAPLAARARMSRKKFKEIYHSYRAKTRKRPINTSENYTREWAVDTLYPRILFTFSDIVCLVSKNMRMIETHIAKLLTWADNVFEKSLNQPMLPKAIIIVNGVEDENNSNDWWDVDKVTNMQLENHQDRIDLYRPSEPSSPRFLRRANATALRAPVSEDNVTRLAYQWRTERKKTINSLRDLILCYYSDFKIICIPSKCDPPFIINKQYAKLRELIATAAQESQNARKLAGLLMTGEELDYYLEQGFAHFSTSKLPFNFLQAAVKAKPVSTGFSDHLLRTALLLLRQRPNDSGIQLLGDLAPIVASSIFLDVIRKRLPYKGNLTDMFEKYRHLCENAQTKLYREYWCCEERDKNRNRCVNSQNGHAKGHQNYKGKVFKTGEFRVTYELDSASQINFFSQKVIWNLELIFKNWEERLRACVINPKEEKREALNLHLSSTSMLHNYSRADIPSKLTSHTTCLYCLISTPSYPLFCGHVICQECLECFAKKEQNDFELDKCPLHDNREWTPPWRTNLGPPTSGLRILSLDGGGVRSMVQLTILHELEKVIDLGVNIVDFFDLIIGTSGGGIVAAGLGIGKLPTQECIIKFSQFAKEAFVKQKGADIPGFKTVAEAVHHGRYKATNMEEALQKVFGEKTLLFGGQRNPTGKSTARVGIPATTPEGRAFLLANYQRPQLTDPLVDHPDYKFYRGETAKEELKVWEALRATSAAPRYFKSFYHEASGYTFDDGGITYNNPVALANTERKIIWPEQKERDPDILLSIGTLWSDKDRSDPKKLDKIGSKAKLALHEYPKKVLNIAVNAIKDNLDCEKTWSTFYNSLNIAEEDEYRKKKYCRINPKVPNARPPLDSVSGMDELQRIAQEYCSKSPVIKIVASTLIASLFYFELKDAKETSQAGYWKCEGEILCRLPANSESLKRLCNRLGDNHQSLFSITSIRDEHGQPCKVLGSAQKVFEEVSAGEHFHLPVTFKKWECDAECRIYVTLNDPNGEGFLISGFPRDPLTDRTWFLYRNFLTGKNREGKENGSRAKHLSSRHSFDNLTKSTKDASLSDPDSHRGADDVMAEVHRPRTIEN